MFFHWGNYTFDGSRGPSWERKAKTRQKKTGQDRARQDKTRQVWILMDLGGQVGRQKRAKIGHDKRRQGKTREDTTHTREAKILERKETRRCSKLWGVGKVCPAIRGRLLHRLQNSPVALPRCRLYATLLPSWSSSFFSQHFPTPFCVDFDFILAPQKGSQIH